MNFDHGPQRFWTRHVRLGHIAWLVVGLVLMACHQKTVIRVRDGYAHSEHAIPGQAYAAYARGRLSESKGDRAAAVGFYSEVLRLDPDSTEAYVRLGALACDRDPRLAAEYWDKAQALDQDFWQLWLEQARCALGRGDVPQADRFARRALELAPQQPEVTLLCSALAEQQNEPARQTQLLFGLLARQPSYIPGWMALATAVQQPEAYREYARRRLLQLRPIDEHWVPPRNITRSPRNPLQQLQEQQLRREFELALARRDRSRAEQLATQLGYTPDQVAWDAFKWGNFRWAQAAAEQLLRLDSSDIRAWLLATLCADINRDEPSLNELVRRFPKVPLGDTQLLPWLDELVKRRGAPDTVN